MTNDSQVVGGGNAGNPRTQVSSLQFQGSCCSTYDGNGNVVLLTDTNGTLVSSLDYAPFGAVLTRLGAHTPRYQFSSKEWDWAAGLNYYGYRFYRAGIGRWLSRDPLLEDSLVERLNLSTSVLTAQGNLYAMAFNAPISLVEYLGLGILCECSIVAYLPPNPTLPHGSELEDGGKCTIANQGRIGTQTIVVICSQTVIGRWWCIDCGKRQCGYRVKWRCDGFLWRYIGEEKFDNC